GLAGRPEPERETMRRPGRKGVLRGLWTHVVGSPKGRLDLPQFRAKAILRSNGHGLGTALASAAARVGRRLVPPQRAALAGRARGRPAPRAAAVRPGLLSVPGQ